MRLRLLVHLAGWMDQEQPSPGAISPGRPGQAPRPFPILLHALCHRPAAPGCTGIGMTQPLCAFSGATSSTGTTPMDNTFWAMFPKMRVWSPLCPWAHITIKSTFISLLWNTDAGCHVLLCDGMDVMFDHDTLQRLGQLCQVCRSFLLVGQMRLTMHLVRRLLLDDME